MRNSYLALEGKGQMENLADDLLQGMTEISRFIKATERQGFYLAENGLIPGVFKRGNRWVGLKSKIREGYNRLASGGAA